MGYSKDHESSHFRNKTTTIKLSAIKTSDAMGANGPFLPTTSNTANAQQRPRGQFARASVTVSKSMNSTNYQ